MYTPKDLFKPEIDIVLPIVEHLKDKTIDYLKNMKLPKGVIWEQVNEERVIMDYKHLGIDLDIVDGKFVPCDEFMVYSEDKDGSASVFVGMINPYTFNMSQRA